MQANYQPSDTFWETVEKIIHHFESDYSANQSVNLSSYLPEASVQFQSTPGNKDRGCQFRRLALIELIKVDLELRWRDNCGFQLPHYVSAYPEIGPLEELQAELVFEAFNAQRINGVSDLEIFCKSFPTQRSDVVRIESQFQISKSITRRAPPIGLRVGQRFGDFLLIRLLGSGSFAHVFLARQLSLDRCVALKISANHGNEARTMATLEHDHIVQVYSETLDETSGNRLFCMQYVPGTTLGSVLSAGKDERRYRPPKGYEILDTIDKLTVGPANLQVNALGDRGRLAIADETQAICLIGMQLADALEFAHQNGVLHRDIKPDNILLNPFGRLFLSDFNLSTNLKNSELEDNVGGSLAYMAPEHLAAYRSGDPAGELLVDVRSDIYSLGAVLFEWATGTLPCENGRLSDQKVSDVGSLQNQQIKASLEQAKLAPVLTSTIAKCLAQPPVERFQSAADLRSALRAAEQWQGINRSLPPNGILLNGCQRFPIVAMLTVAILPNVLGSLINIAYNSIYILPRLTPQQEIVFRQITFAYNAIVYPTCIALVCWQASWFWRTFWRTVELQLNQRDWARENLVKLPSLVLVVCCLGWLPGGLLFPTVIHIFSGPLEIGIFAHFVLDFAISGLIAITYLFFGMQCLLLRTLYVPLLAGQHDPIETANRELARIKPRLRLAQVGAGVIPLSGALFLVFLGPAHGELSWLFRCLVLTLIGAGMIGFSVSVSVADSLQRTLDAICGGTVGGGFEKVSRGP